VRSGSLQRMVRRFVRCHFFSPLLFECGYEKGCDSASQIHGEPRAPCAGACVSLPLAVDVAMLVVERG
jgi:hypothetical protein